MRTKHCVSCGCDRPHRMAKAGEKLRLECVDCGQLFTAECRRCKAVAVMRIVERPDTNHGFEFRCPGCECHFGWVGKEDGSNRQAKHRRLVKKYGNGFCEMCLRDESELRSEDTLIGHHVREYHDGGTDDRENVWILCTACHSHVHWLRTYHGNNIVETLASELTQ